MHMHNNNKPNLQPKEENQGDTVEECGSDR